MQLRPPRPRIVVPDLNVGDRTGVPAPPPAFYGVCGVVAGTPIQIGGPDAFPPRWAEGVTNSASLTGVAPRLYIIAGMGKPCQDARFAGDLEVRRVRRV